MSRQGASEEFSHDWEASITQGLRVLIQTKHLYQSLQLSQPDVLAMEKATRLPGGQSAFFDEEVAWAKGLWSLVGPSNPSYLGKGGPRPQPAARLPDLKIYCRQCSRVEAYNPVKGHDSVPEGMHRSRAEPTTVIQIFTASFRCQSCKSFPEFFFIRREGLKLTLSGRSPIEYVVVPKAIPKEISGFISSAVVAHQSGHTLAGLFFLRTAIEQWVYSQVGSRERADTALESYRATLPGDFRSRFPSLSSLYEKLSEALHAVIPSVKLFESTILDLEKHFEARRLVEL